MAEIRVQICYARPDSQWLKEVRVPANATLRSAVEASGLLDEFPELDLAALKIGIYGKLKTFDTPLRPHDRVEIYRPLVADPKESRRRRALKKDVKNSA